MRSFSFRGDRPITVPQRTPQNYNVDGSNIDNNTVAGRHSSSFQTYFANKIRTLVSKKKKRFKEDGFNLDLTYICPHRIIAMGFPSSGQEGIYRNNAIDVKEFLSSKHASNYKVFNLCSERSYSPDLFDGRVSCYPFDDHNPPPMRMFLPFCEDAHQWLLSSSNNVMAVHCKAGKGRTGVMVCAYLIFIGYFDDADECMSYYADVRTDDSKGITIPSQRRFIRYFAELCKAVPHSDEKSLIELRHTMCLCSSSSSTSTNNKRGIQSEQSMNSNYNNGNDYGNGSSNRILNKRESFESDDIEIEIDVDMEDEDDDKKVTGSSGVGSGSNVVIPGSCTIPPPSHRYNSHSPATASHSTPFTPCDSDSPHHNHHHHHLLVAAALALQLSPISPSTSTSTSISIASLQHENKFLEAETESNGNSLKMNGVSGLRDNDGGSYMTSASLSTFACASGLGSGYNRPDFLEESRRMTQSSSRSIVVNTPPPSPEDPLSKSISSTASTSANRSVLPILRTLPPVTTSTATATVTSTADTDYSQSQSQSPCQSQSRSQYSVSSSSGGSPAAMSSLRRLSQGVLVHQEQPQLQHQQKQSQHQHQQSQQHQQQLSSSLSSSTHPRLQPPHPVPVPVPVPVSLHGGIGLGTGLLSPRLRNVNVEGGDEVDVEIEVEGYKLPLRRGKVPPPKQMCLSSIRLRNCPKSTLLGGSFKPVFQLCCGLSTYISSSIGDEISETEILFEDLDIPIVDEFLIKFYNKNAFSNGHIFQFWLHTYFIQSSKLILNKNELDKCVKDKHHTRFPKDFNVEVEFADLEYMTVM
eukprot:gene5660-11421_t